MARRTENRAKVGDGAGAADALVDPVADGGPAVLGALDALARQALGNDPVVVRRFLIGIAPTIRRVCRGVLGRHDPDLEDVVQDCLVDTMRALPRYRFEGSVVHYVTKISIRRAMAARGRTTLRSGRFPALDERRAEWNGEGQGEGDAAGDIAGQRSSKSGWCGRSSAT
jgi:DNA-directed RNA polymerase specialized sigma24 family protein